METRLRSNARRVALSLAAASGCLAVSAAHAADWRYCLATEPSGRLTYVTSPFLATGDLASVEAGFASALRRSGTESETVQCPRADTESRLVEMRGWAERYAASRGIRAVDVDWSPGTASAAMRPAR